MKAWCLRYPSIAVIKHHDQSNIPRKALNRAYGFKRFESTVTEQGTAESSCLDSQPESERETAGTHLSKPQSLPLVTHFLQQSHTSCSFPYSSNSWGPNMQMYEPMEATLTNPNSVKLNVSPPLQALLAAWHVFTGLSMCPAMLGRVS